MTVSAPYNFVPLSKHVCKVEDIGLKGPPSQDTPEVDAKSGTIEVTLTCDTPLLVNWAPERVEGVKTMGLVDAAPVIPGSTLRGMIRNVLEIATFGKMALVDDARTTVRDLQATARMDYGSRMAVGNGTIGYSPVSCAGWLRMDEGALRLVPCEFGRIDHDDLPGWLGGFHSETVSCIASFNANKTRTVDDMAQAGNVESLFLKKGKTLTHTLFVQVHEDRHSHSQPLRYRRVAPTREAAETANVSAVRKDGTLVFTGMPSGRKHMEFFFLDPRPEDTLSVDPVVWRKFLDAHERQEKESGTWVWRRKALYGGNEIPVFYLQAGGQVTALGLAMMFKLPAERSIGEMIDTTSLKHRDTVTVDLAERIFGRLETGKGNGWRGRVSFGWALAQAGTWQEPTNQDKAVIMAKPKPGFPAAYVRQKDLSGVDGTSLIQVGTRTVNGNEVPVRSQYRSYMTWTTIANKSVHDEVRGWKRYPVGPERGLEGPSATGESASQMRPIRPLRGQPITFTFTLRYHNLHPVELGAVLWALTWGGDARLRHALGMGRPFGWGRTAMSVSPTDEQRAALVRFTGAMEEWANREGMPGGWAGSVQLRQLRAMADPGVGAAQSAALRQMRIVVGQVNGNDFVRAKAAGQVLPEYGLVDLSPCWDGPDPNEIKIPDDGPPANTRTARENAMTLRELINRNRERAAAERETEEKQKEGRNRAAEAENQFPVGSKVTVRGETAVRVVLAQEGKTWRILSKTGNEKVAERGKFNVSRLNPSP